jgi:hypothetical protein
MNRKHPAPDGSGACHAESYGESKHANHCEGVQYCIKEKSTDYAATPLGLVQT